MIDYPGLRADQERLRAIGVYRGIGFASFIELTNPPLHVRHGGRASRRRTVAACASTRRLGGGGDRRHRAGQGTEAIIRQIVAEGVGVPIDQVRVITGDTAMTPYGGGTWACTRRRHRRRVRRCRRGWR
jgi:carbon-monoxide dehydrogenase large subunit